MHWFPHTLIRLIFLASTDFFVKLTSNKIALHKQVLARALFVKTSLLLDEFEKTYWVRVEGDLTLEKLA